jgi:hypothetical protein
VGSQSLKKSPNGVLRPKLAYAPKKMILNLHLCGFDQVYVVPNDNGTFLELTYLLRALTLHCWTWSVTTGRMKLKCCCEFEAIENRTQRYMVRMAASAAFVNELH